MSQHTHHMPLSVQSAGDVRSMSPARQAWWLLYLGFIAAPILAGLDKFAGVMTDWTQYLAPQVSALLGGHDQAFFYVVGVVEIAAGIGVAVLPRWFAYVVAAWLLGIIANLLLGGAYLDVALRDLGLMLGALALARLSITEARGPHGD